MNKEQLIKSLEECVAKNSRYETKRNYLSMSRIGECPLILYKEYLQGTIPNYANYSGAFLGYTFEDIIAKWLIDLKVIDPTTRNLELSALEGKFKGHIDGSTNPKTLIEIKSVNKKKFDQIRQDTKVPTKNFLQAQTYMYHGKFEETTIFYVCRETMEFEIKRFNCIPIIGQRMTEKAQTILTAVSPPDCECGFCK